MTLGELIEALKEKDPDLVINRGFGSPHSYRGYYDCLSFEPDLGRTSVRDLLSIVESSLGKTFEGWKGGKYTMHEYTDVYLAHWGSTGEELGSTLLGYMLADV